MTTAWPGSVETKNASLPIAQTLYAEPDSRWRLAEMFTSQAQSTQDSNIQRIGKHVPIYLFAGREDPLNNKGKDSLPAKTLSGCGVKG